MSCGSRGEIEARIAAALVRFQREQHGRGPDDARVHIVGDLVLARCTGIFTPIEATLAATDDGRRLIRSAREELHGIAHEDEDRLVEEATGARVIRSYYDVDAGAAEQVTVFVLDRNLEKEIGGSKPRV